MRALGIEQVPRAGFDHDPQLQFVEQLAQTHQVRRFGCERIGVVIVQRERHAPITTVGDDLQRVLQLVMREPVCVVTEAQIHLACPDRQITAAVQARKITWLRQICQSK